MSTKELSYPYFPQPGGQEEVWQAMSPENKSKYIGFFGPRGIGKTVSPNDLVELYDGTYKEMGKMSIGDIVISKNTRGYFEPKPVTGLHITEEKKRFYKIRTSSGLEIHPAETHRLLTDIGWTLAPDLKSGNYIAVARNGVFGSKKIPKQLLRLIAFCIGDGTLSNVGNEVRITSSYPEINNAVKSDCQNLNCRLRIGYDNSSSADRKRTRQTTVNFIYGTLVDTIKAYSLNHKARQKFIPKDILALDKEHLSYFLMNLYATDGHFHWDGKKGVIGYSTVSKRLADDIMFCLRKYGINARTQKTVSQRRGKVFGDLYVVNIKNKNHIKIFANEIGAFCERHKIALAGILEKIGKSQKQSMGADVIPVSLTSKAVEGFKMDSYHPNYGSLKSCRGRGDRPSVNRESVQKLADAFPEELKELHDLAYNDVFWDTIESIEETGLEYGYDIEVADNHNYIANGIVSHNSYCMRSNFVTIGMKHKLECCIVRRTFEDLKENHIIPMRNELKDWIDMKMVKVNMQDKSFTLPNGSRLVFLYCARDSDLDRFQGKAFDIMGIEEAGQFTEFQLTYMLSSNRASPTAISNNTEYPIKALFTFNWGGPGHRFLRKKFHDKQYETDEDPSMYCPIIGRYEDNKIFHKVDPDYQRRLRNLPLQLQRAYIDGDPDAFTGTVFNVVDTIHEVAPREVLKEYDMIIPGGWTLYGSLDPGTYSPCSFGLYTKTPEGQVYKILHYYERDRNPEQHAYSIWDAIKGCPYTGGRMPSYIVAGADAFHKQSRRSINAHDVTWKDIFRDIGLHLVPANTSAGSRRAGKAALHTALHFEFSHSTQEVTKLPMLRFFKGQCKETLSELREIENAEHDPEDTKQGPEVRDHAYDETRYAIMQGVRPTHEVEEKRQVAPDPRADYGRLLSEANKNPLATDVDFEETLGYNWEELL